MSFADEIREQGSALRNLVAFYRSEEGAGPLESVGHMVSYRTRSITFMGMGTSEFVPGVVREYLGDKSSAAIVSWEAGELLHYGLESIRDNDIIIAISQSGESVETRKVVQYLRHHQHLITVTNSPVNSMAREATVNLQMMAGDEATISTKTYTNSMALMLLLSRAIALEDTSSLLSELDEISKGMDEFIANRMDEIRAAADLLMDAQTVYFISRGPAMTAARQAALTFQEGAHVYTTAMPGGSMRHGPFEVAGPGHYAIMYASDGHGGDLVRSMAVEMADLGSKILLMTSEAVPAHENIQSIVLQPGRPELLSLVCAVPQELLIDMMAADRGLTAGVFARGGKITAKE